MARGLQVLFAFLFVAIARAELAPVHGLNGLPELPLVQLSQRDPNPLGVAALGIHSGDWKHAETEHFIYHFMHGFVATPVSVEAEFHYRVVAKELEKVATAGEKSHIYIFENAADWELFQTKGKLEPWTGGMQSDGSLFIVRDPAYKFTDNSLGHEIAHLVLYRFYGRGIACWLNEGFAQYVSKGAHASYQRARGYNAKPRSQAVGEEKLFPLAQLTAMSYPPAEQVATFYDESERLVRFFVANNRRKFLALLEAMGKGEAFDTALLHTYGARFTSVDALEQEFKAYAAKDFGSSMQDR